MLADLVNGGCIVEDGSGALNNPLGRLGKAVLDAGQSRDLVSGGGDGGGSSSQDAMLPPYGVAGPSSSGLLPAMGASEAAFLQAFEANSELQAGWDAAASGTAAPPFGLQRGGMPMGPPPPAAMSAEAAWHAVANVAALPPMSALEHDAHALAGGEVRAALRGLAHDPSTPCVAGERLLARLQLSPADHAAAARRADAFAAHLRPPRPSVVPFPAGMAPMGHPAAAAMGGMPAGLLAHHRGAPHAAPPSEMVMGDAWRASAAPAGVAAAERPLNAAEVSQLDAAHEAAWQSLAQGGEATTAGSQPVPRQLDGGPLDGAAFAHALSAWRTPEQQLAVPTTAQAAGATTAQVAGATTATAQEGLNEGRMNELEAVWQSLSVGERSVASGALAGASATDLDGIWEALKGGDYEFDASWDKVWESAREGGASAAAAALAGGSEADAPYTFRQPNRHVGGEGLLERGTELFRRGELQEAILVLEAAVTADPDSSLGWQTLGQAHADADDDVCAITCLRRAVAVDPHNLDALLALGVSYTNELDQTRALEHLQLWLDSHPDFAALADHADHAAGSLGEGGGEMGVLHPFELQQRVTARFQRAVTAFPDNHDLHAVLGVLHNLSRSYDEAIGAFQAALRLRPTDYSLWNKLGATQANSMSCAQAVPCYISALEHKPQYVRALSNLGISYGNMANYDAAAQCYLKALSLNPQAAHIWGYLTMTFTSMGRPDLVAKVNANDHEAFRADFDF